MKLEHNTLQNSHALSDILYNSNQCHNILPWFTCGLWHNPLEDSIQLTKMPQLHMLQTEHSPWNFLAHFFDFSLGGGFLGMRKRARIGWRSQRGGWDSAISRAVMPKDHRSLRLSYVASGFSSHAITSGAIQYGVPINVLRRPIVRSNCALTPKSTDKGNQQLIKKAKNWGQNPPSQYNWNHIWCYPNSLRKLLLSFNFSSSQHNRKNISTTACHVNCPRKFKVILNFSPPHQKMKQFQLTTDWHSALL